MKLLVVLTAVLSLVACGGVFGGPTPTPTVDPEREAMLAFTRQALQIEAERAELMQYFASQRGTGAPAVIYSWMGRAFAVGVPVGEYNPGPPHELAGMEALYQRLLLLDCPQSVQTIKDALSHIYDSELLTMALSGYGQTNTGYGRADTVDTVYADVTKDNVDQWKQRADAAKAAGSRSPEQRYYADRVESRWGRLQVYRGEVYVRWAQLLRDHGIDPAKEGVDSTYHQVQPSSIPAWPSSTTEYGSVAKAWGLETR